MARPHSPGTRLNKERLMKKQLALVVAVVLGLLWIVALGRGLTGWAQGPGGDGRGGPAASSANLPDGIEIASPPDQTAAVEAEDIEAAALYNANLQVVGSALRPRESDTEWASSGSGGCIYTSAGDSYTVYNTPVYLPQGATVKYLRMYFYDTNASYNSAAWFTAYDPNANIAGEWLVTSTGSAGAGYTMSNEFTHIVNYEYYSYVLNWRPYDTGSDMQLCGFRIYYRTPPGYSYLPLAIK
jgi:hypothetical protein